MTSLDSFPDDCLPPENQYESQEALFQAIKSWAAPRCYAFTTLRSTKKSGQLLTTYGCDRSRKPQAVLKDGWRRQPSYGAGCEFSVLARETQEETWILKYRPDHRFSVHNHAPRTNSSSELKYHTRSLCVIVSDRFKNGFRGSDLDYRATERNLLKYSLTLTQHRLFKAAIKVRKMKVNPRIRLSHL